MSDWSSFWWGCMHADDAGRKLWATFETIRSQHLARLERLKRLTDAYRNVEPVNGFDPFLWKLRGIFGAPVTFNVVRSAINTAVARLSLRDPMAMWGTSAGDQKQKQIAQARTKLAAGVIQRERAFSRSFIKALKDCAIGDFGCVRPKADGEQIRVKRVHPSRIFWDETAALDDDPPSLYELSWPTPEELAAMFTRRADDIMREAKRLSVAGIDGVAARQVVECVEAFHPARGNAPGRRAIAIEGVGVLVQDWDGPWPHKFVRWDGGDVLGFSSVSAGDELLPLQEELDFILERIAENAEAHSGAKIWKPKGCEVNTDDLARNDPNAVHEYVGDRPPTLQLWDIMSPQYFQWAETVYRRAFEIVGVSEFSATSKMPGPRMESGEAIRAYQEPESVRFAPLERAYTELVVDVSEEITREARRLARTHKGWAVSYLERDRTLTQVKWSDAEGSDNGFTVFPQAQSGLPMQPAARLSKLHELARDQVVDRATFIAYAGPLMGADMEDWWQLANAPVAAIRKLLDSMLAAGDYLEECRPFEAMPGLELGVQIAMAYLARGVAEGRPKAEADLLVTWITDAAALIKARTMPAPQAGAPVVPSAPTQVAAPPPSLGPGVAGPPTMPGPGPMPNA